MICPVFETVGEDQEFSLADLKVTGYDPSTQNPQGLWIGGCNANAFELKKLSKDGTCAQENKYYYFDYKSGREDLPATYKDYTGDKAGWYTKDEKGTTFTKVDEKKVTFPNGQAFWTKSAISGKVLKLVSAGSVSRKEIAFPTIYGYNVGAGNGTPVKLTLDDLYVTGYDPSTQNPQGLWIGGCNANAFELKKLSKDGTCTQENKFYYFDYKSGREDIPATYKDYTGDKAGWYTKDEKGTTFTKVDAAKVPVPAGQGFWIKGAISGKTLLLHVPAPELDAKDAE